MIYKKSVRTSQETDYVSATKPNRLILFRETDVVYCENHMIYTNTLCGQKTKELIYKSSSYLIGNTLSLHYEA
jgi:hypothetical protein